MIFWAAFDRLLRIERIVRCDDFGRKNVIVHNRMRRSVVLAKWIMTLVVLACLVCPSDALAKLSYKTSAEAKADASAQEAAMKSSRQCAKTAKQRQVELANDFSKRLQRDTELKTAQRQVESDCIQAIQELRQGLYCSQCNRSKSEIERQTGRPFEEHLIEVQGVPIPAPPQAIAQKEEECRQKFDEATRRIAENDAEMRRIAERSHTERMKELECQMKADIATANFFRAKRWYEALAKLEAQKKLNEKLFPKELTADKFGLGKNMRSSEFEVVRAYLKNGQVVTLGPGVNVNPDDIVRIATHRGLDFASRDYDDPSKAKPMKPMSFNAGITGKAWSVPGSEYNTINVKVDQGNGNYYVVQYLHSSEPSKQLANCSEAKPCSVSPWTRLGMTGGKNPGNKPMAIHLHVQAVDQNGRFVDPDMAFLPKGNPFAGIEAGVSQDMRMYKPDE